MRDIPVFLSHDYTRIAGKMVDGVIAFDDGYRPSVATLTSKLTIDPAYHIEEAVMIDGVKCVTKLRLIEVSIIARAAE